MRPTDVFLFLMPPDWRSAFRTLRSLRVVRARAVVWTSALSVVKVFAEAFGIAMVLPLLQYIENGRDFERLAGESEMWRLLGEAYGLIGLPVTLATLSGTVFALICLRQVTVYVAVIELEKLKEQITFALRARLFNEVLSAKALYIRTLPTGHFVTLLVQHAQTVGSVVRNFITLLTIYVTFATYGGMLLATAPIVTGVCLLFGLTIIRLMQRYADAARSIGKQTVTVQQDYTHFLTERFRGWRLIKLSNRQAMEDSQNQRVSDRLQTLAILKVVIAGRIQLILFPLATGVALAALYVAATYTAIGISEIAVFVLIVMRLLPVLDLYLKTKQAFNTLTASLNRVVQVEDEALSYAEEDEGDETFREVARAIRFEGVTFRYQDEARPALVGVDLTLPARMVTAIVGPSGAGKSTLIDLIPRLIAPAEGRITVDGEPLERYSRRSLRSKCAYVSQNPLLFDLSVTENIRYADPEASEEAVIEAAKQAHAHDFILGMPDGYDTPLGEDGQRLSGGQKQRIALARAFLADAAVLILDEPTSALDYESEREIRAALREIRQRAERTVLLIAHRPSTIADADHVVVMREGRVEMVGPPAEVSRDDAWFAGMATDEAAKSAIDG